MDADVVHATGTRSPCIVVSPKEGSVIVKYPFEVFPLSPLGPVGDLEQVIIASEIKTAQANPVRTNDTFIINLL
jgi:hypothetical protein